jgi:hypothetical protein
VTYLDCGLCNGTGRDGGAWDERCSWRNGTGVVPDDEDDRKDDQDEEEQAND